MRKGAIAVFIGLIFFAGVLSARAEEKLSGDFVVVSIEGNVVKAKNKATGTRLPLEVGDQTEILHQGQHERTLADIKKGDEFSGEYTIQDKKYLATKIDLK